MSHFTTGRFWRCYEALSPEMRSVADKQYELMKVNPSHPSLHLKKVGAIWSVRISISLRALAAEKDGNLIWFWIGSHQEYERLLKL